MKLKANKVYEVEMFTEQQLTEFGFAREGSYWTNCGQSIDCEDIGKKFKFRTCNGYYGRVALSCQEDVSAAEERAGFSRFTPDIETLESCAKVLSCKSMDFIDMGDETLLCFDGEFILDNEFNVLPDGAKVIKQLLKMAKNIDTRLGKAKK